MVSRGLSSTFAEQVFQQLKGFGEYGFPESHAASFALLVYVSAWLKFHYPAAFTAALLGSQPMGFYAPAQLVRDAQEHGVTVLPVCIQNSGWHAGLENSGESLPALRLGLEQVHGLGQTSGHQIEEVRNSGRFNSIYDLTKRCQLTQPQVLSLARAGALKSLSGSRRQAVWNSMERKPEPGSMPLFEGLAGNGFNETESSFDETGDLPMTSHLEEVLSDYRALGLSLKAHPLEFIRSHLMQHGVVTAAGACSCPEGGRVIVVGIVLSRQRPATAKGTIFLTLEDETDIVNVVVPKAVWQHCGPKNRRAPVLMVKGRIQRRGNVVHLLARRLEAWREDDTNELSLVDLPRMSRDFC
jgi:error-prone DNA polymerase